MYSIDYESLVESLNTHKNTMGLSEILEIAFFIRNNPETIKAPNSKISLARKISLATNTTTTKTKTKTVQNYITLACKINTLFHYEDNKSTILEKISEQLAHENLTPSVVNLTYFLLNTTPKQYAPNMSGKASSIFQIIGLIAVMQSAYSKGLRDAISETSGN